VVLRAAGVGDGRGAEVSGEGISKRGGSAPFFGASGLKSVSEISKSPKGALKAGSFAEPRDVPFEPRAKGKIFSPAAEPRTPIEPAARLRKMRMPTPFFPEL
jgi:hypothetical protein